MPLTAFFFCGVSVFGVFRVESTCRLDLVVEASHFAGGLTVTGNIPGSRVWIDNTTVVTADDQVETGSNPLVSLTADTVEISGSTVLRTVHLTATAVSEALHVDALGANFTQLVISTRIFTSSFEGPNSSAQMDVDVGPAISWSGGGAPSPRLDLSDASIVLELPAMLALQRGYTGVRAQGAEVKLHNIRFAVRTNSSGAGTTTSSQLPPMSGVLLDAAAVACRADVVNASLTIDAGGAAMHPRWRRLVGIGASGRRAPPCCFSASQARRPVFRLTYAIATSDFVGIELDDASLSAQKSDAPRANVSDAHSIAGSFTDLLLVRAPAKRALRSAGVASVQQRSADDGEGQGLATHRSRTRTASAAHDGVVSDVVTVKMPCGCVAEVLADLVRELPPSYDPHLVGHTNFTCGAHAQRPIVVRLAFDVDLTLANISDALRRTRCGNDSFVIGDASVSNAANSSDYDSPAIILVPVVLFGIALAAVGVSMLLRYFGFGTKARRARFRAMRGEAVQQQEEETDAYVAMRDNAGISSFTSADQPNSKIREPSHSGNDVQNTTFTPALGASGSRGPRRFNINDDS